MCEQGRSLIQDCMQYKCLIGVWSHSESDSFFSIVRNSGKPSASPSVKEMEVIFRSHLSVPGQLNRRCQKADNTASFQALGWYTAIELRPLNIYLLLSAWREEASKKGTIDQALEVPGDTATPAEQSKHPPLNHIQHSQCHVPDSTKTH